MKCPYCATPDTKVVDSRLNQTSDITRRRRECLRCEARFTTYERVEEVMPLVIKKDGRREPFQRSKLVEGMNKACEKRSIATQRIEDTVVRIERRVQNFALKEIPSRTLGEMMMAELHRLDKVAYVRFASVYREFRDVQEFVAELQASPAEAQSESEITQPELVFAETPVEGSPS